MTNSKKTLTKHKDSLLEEAAIQIVDDLEMLIREHFEFASGYPPVIYDREKREILRRVAERFNK